MNKVLAIVMAGGEGTRLSVLANRRAKPAVPFAGIYRIIDFTLSNVMHSGIGSVGVITQYRPYSLVDHLGLGEWWGMSGFGRKLKVLSPHTGGEEASFYMNTADAIYRNIEFIERFPDVTDVMILSGDHIYKMDYRPMLRLHRETGAVATLATQEVPWEETSRFGIMVCDDQDRITQFQEKPKQNPMSNKASLGIYIFNRKRLVQALIEDHNDPSSSHDFGKDVIPKMVAGELVYNYTLNDYWRDVGTIASYMATSMEALDPASGLDLASWGVRTNHGEIHLENQMSMRLALGASVRKSLISKGVLIEGSVSESILSPGVWIGPESSVTRCILLHGVQVGAGCVLEDVIIDKNGCVGTNVRIGDPRLGNQANQQQPHLLNTGTTVIGKAARIEDGISLGRNCLVYPGVAVTKGHGVEIAAGATVAGMA